MELKLAPKYETATCCFLLRQICQAENVLEDYTRREPVLLCFVKNWVCRIQLPSGTFSLQNLFTSVQNKIYCPQLHCESSTPKQGHICNIKTISSIVLKYLEMQRDNFLPQKAFEGILRTKT